MNSFALSFRLISITQIQYVIAVCLDINLSLLQFNFILRYSNHLHLRRIIELIRDKTMIINVHCICIATILSIRENAIVC